MTASVLSAVRPRIGPGPDPELLVHDRFDQPRAPGTVVGSAATSGATRHGADREGTLSIDDGQLRMGWMAHGGWGRAVLAYGPFEDLDGLVLVVRAMNGLTTSQTDWRPEGGRAKVKRWRATLPHASIRRPVLRDSLVMGWFAEPAPDRAPEPIAAVSHRAGAHAVGELWFHAGGRSTRVSADLQNLPATYVIAIRSGVASLHAWSYEGAGAFGAPGSTEPLAQLPIADHPPGAAHAAVHQVILGEVHYRVDTRVEDVQVWRNVEPASIGDAPVARGWWDPPPRAVVVADDFGGEAGPLEGREVPRGRRRWQRLTGDGRMLVDGRGRARVDASLDAPNPGRTVFGVPWAPGGADGGVEVAATVIPPGTERGQGHQGRSGLVIWQDQGNHLVVNHFIDDGSVGVSISAFLRTGGHEAMFDWDATWTNVGTRVRWGEPFLLRVACDERGFLCRIGDEPVLYRRFTDYRAGAAPLRTTAVGLVANWEWGDDTGTAFEGFSVRPLTAPSLRTAAGPAPRPAP